MNDWIILSHLISYDIYEESFILSTLEDCRFTNVLSRIQEAQKTFSNMPPRLRALAGTSLANLVPITELVNTPRTFELSSDVFKGKIVAHIKGMTGEDGSPRNSEYFEREDRSGITWSIQVQGINSSSSSFVKNRMLTNDILVY